MDGRAPPLRRIRVPPETAGANVAIMPQRSPAAMAASNIASFGFSTGTSSSRAARSIALPKAEQV
jgi:hypothetical protein